MKSFKYVHFILSSLIPVLISLSCSSFVAVKIYDCIAKYASEPQANLVTIEKNDGLPFPTLTICPNWFGSGLKTKKLKKCGLKWQDYQAGNWIGNCTDPEKLFKSIVEDFDVLIKDNKFFTKDAKIWSQRSAFYKPIDSLHGRCYSIIPKDKVLEKGIVELLIKTEHKHILIHVSSKGEFLTGTFGPGLDQKSTILLEHSHGVEEHFKVINETLAYEMYEQLNTKKQPCNESLEYSKDECFLQKLHEESIKQLGCTTPYGLNKSLICTDMEKASKAMKLYSDLQRQSPSFCLSSCQYSVPQTFFSYHKKSSSNHSYLHLANTGSIKVTRSEWAYDTLSLIADIGGYVGLFLGIAIVHVKEVFQYLAKKVDY